VLLNRLKKAFTILELLVVIIIIGVVSIVAIPNVREFLTERETKSGVFSIVGIVDSFKSNLESGLSRNPNNIANDAHGTYVMGSIDFLQWPQFFQMYTLYRSDELFRTLKTCDATSLGGWERRDGFHYSVYPAFQNIIISDAAQSVNQYTRVWMCLAKVPTLITTSTLTFHVCNSYNNPSRTCGINFKNNPIYRLQIQRLGNITIEKYNYNNSTWNVIQK
jgi:prepilin-type N-terminal cleavage/methylation domain-containing protein